MNDYDFELDRIIGEVNKSKAKIVGLQFPEGLKQQATEITRAIEDKTKAKTIIFVDPTYGACDLKERQAKKLGIDMLIHFGHSDLKPG
jgi:2-(3-amino-3-carboxypropyl)histidine synthase